MTTVIDMTGDAPEVIREGKGSLQAFGISDG
jgi:tRNA A37 threonylcarbamoyladenosine synthetase subunit TsaC/SUA5/YrdC